MKEVAKKVQVQKKTDFIYFHSNSRLVGIEQIIKQRLKMMQFQVTVHGMLLAFKMFPELNQSLNENQLCGPKFEKSAIGANKFGYSKTVEYHLWEAENSFQNHKMTIQQ